MDACHSEEGAYAVTHARTVLIRPRLLVVSTRKFSKFSLFPCYLSVRWSVYSDEQPASDDCALTVCTR